MAGCPKKFASALSHNLRGGARARIVTALPVPWHWQLQFGDVARSDVLPVRERKLKFAVVACF